MGTGGKTDPTALKVDKRRTEAWNMKASTLGLLNKTDEAIECFDKSLLKTALR